MRRIVAVIVVGVVIGVGCRPPRPVLPAVLLTPLAGVYVCRGHNSDHTPYTTAMTLVADGDRYQMLWTVEGYPIMRGVALMMDRTLLVALYTNNSTGIAIYAVSPGFLEGTWSTTSNTMLPERCEIAGDHA